MEELRKAHTATGLSLEPKLQQSGMSDKRLSLFGYSTETIQMLLLPMIMNK